MENSLCPQRPTSSLTLSLFQSSDFSSQESTQCILLLPTADTMVYALLIHQPRLHTKASLNTCFTSLIQSPLALSLLVLCPAADLSKKQLNSSTLLYFLKVSHEFILIGNISYDILWKLVFNILKEIIVTSMYPWKLHKNARVHNFCKIAQRRMLGAITAVSYVWCMLILH